MPDCLPCALCGRPLERGQLTKHHCLPRQKGGTPADIERICRQCHGMVHATYTNATLAALSSNALAARRQQPSPKPRMSTNGTKPTIPSSASTWR